MTGATGHLLRRLVRLCVRLPVLTVLFSSLLAAGSLVSTIVALTFKISNLRLLPPGRRDAQRFAEHLEELGELNDVVAEGRNPGAPGVRGPARGRVEDGPGESPACHRHLARARPPPRGLRHGRGGVRQPGGATERDSLHKGELQHEGRSDPRPMVVHGRCVVSAPLRVSGRRGSPRRRSCKSRSSASSQFCEIPGSRAGHDGPQSGWL